MVNSTAIATKKLYNCVRAPAMSAVATIAQPTSQGQLMITLHFKCVIGQPKTKQK
jgi:hypothetical protein